MSSRGRRWSRTVAVAALTCTAALGAAPPAAAEDNVSNFLSSIFGGGQSQPAYAPPAVQEETPSTTVRPLTVRPRRPKVARSAPVPSKPGKVSIFEDKTLRRGDAVMTRDGMRVFAGSTSWPYRAADFVGVANAGHMDKDFQQTLLSLDKLPRN